MLAGAKRVGICSLRLQRRLRLTPIPTFPLSGGRRSGTRQLDLRFGLDVYRAGSFSNDGLPSGRWWKVCLSQV
ncbi:hypothetical protein ACVWY5_007982 [Bradyrhizobium sp. USDA 3256]